MATQRLRRKLERDGVPENVNLGENFCTFGTPLPSLTEGGKDRNEFKPLWEQEAYDDRGRRRFHGAFTGGFSAGYFNTVGSKEGWTPSAFQSSRASRSDAPSTKQRPEDFMDDEDLADRDATVQLRTTASYSAPEPGAARDPLLAVLAPAASPATQGTHLLQRMGWKPGQGIGPLVSYAQREHLVALLAAMHLAPPHVPHARPCAGHHARYPPPDTRPHQERANRDRHGLGAPEQPRAGESLHDVLSRFHEKPAPALVGASAFDSDDEDHVYSRSESIHMSTLGGGTGEREAGRGAGRKPREAGTRERASAAQGHPSARDPAAPPTSTSWHDGRAMPDGFVASSEKPEELAWFPAPSVPSSWTPSPRRVWSQSGAVSAAVAPHGAGERGEILGEAQHPGPPPAVSAYLDAKARARHAAPPPQAVPPGAPPAPPGPPPLRPGAVPGAQPPLRQPTPPPAQVHVRAVDPDTAQRARQTNVPISADAVKQARYEAYLHAYAERRVYDVPTDAGMGAAEMQQELDAFFDAAMRYCPASDKMANRFTGGSMLQDDAPPNGGGLWRPGAQAPPPPKPAPVAPAPEALTPAQRAARDGDFGALTRSVSRFDPPRLLCKRLGIPAPADAEPVGGADDAVARAMDRFAAAIPAADAADDVDKTPGIVFAPVSTEAEAALEHQLTEEKPPLDLFKAVFESDGEESGGEEGADAGAGEGGVGAEGVPEGTPEAGTLADGASVPQGAAQDATHRGVLPNGLPVSFRKRAAGAGPTKRKKKARDHKAALLTFDMDA
ncbi:hypothetical protein MSPP1_003576 [Malassezia sp. CBS 17886]|nr:hypothetical protein MSPP1_003576 [Malassezia sp. CBS 17886]